VEIIQAREVIIDGVRSFFKRQGFTEVETPLLVAAPDTTPTNEVFETALGGNKRAFLTPSPEFFMKRLISSRYSKIFQICKSFRNPSEISPLHNPEFTILEWYRSEATYTDLMVDCENLVNYLFEIFISKTQNQNLKLKSNLIYQGEKIDLAPPWPRITVKEALRKYARVDLDEFLDFKRAKEIAKKKGYRVEETTSWEQLYHQIFLNEIEPKFPKNEPLILYDYPGVLAALSRLKTTDSRYAERFELYISGLELANGYSELTDWQEQEQRFKNDLAERKRLRMKVFGYDHELIKALKKMPETAGIAIGVDRLIMLFVNAKTIQEVIPFPAAEIFGLSS
jgi:lysyl-tRNA synthetase class 2